MQCAQWSHEGTVALVQFDVGLISIFMQNS